MSIGHKTMKITQLYTYPIKSLRPHSLAEAELTRHGFKYDRRFMLLQVQSGSGGHRTYKNMHVSEFNRMVLFFTELHLPTAPESRDGTILVEYRPPGENKASIEIPLEPDINDLPSIDIEMHKSSTKAYQMNDKYNSWFSKCFGYDVILAYLGSHYRPVLMSTLNSTQAQSNRGWLSSVSGAATALLGSKPEDPKDEITFSDCAPYLVVSERSMDDIHNRLPNGQHMDITKFRPNITVSGAEEPWEEDYWSQVTINGSTKIECVHNCGRCNSINIDYATGRPGTAEAGKMLAKLQKDRRIDFGTKYSPVFGRYSFLHQDSEGHVIKVGQEMVVTRTNQVVTRFGEHFAFDKKSSTNLQQTGKAFALDTFSHASDCSSWWYGVRPDHDLRISINPWWNGRRLAIAWQMQCLGRLLLKCSLASAIMKY